MERERRINKEIKDFGSGGSADIKVEPIPGEKFQFKGTLIGPSETPYEGGTFVVHIIIPNEYAFPTLSQLVGCNSSTRRYPFMPPKMKFDTKVWHPNISSQTGAICLGTDVSSHALQPVLYARSCMDTPILRNTNTVHKHTYVMYTHTHTF
jgi:ubiquitin-protein ligase